MNAIENMLAVIGLVAIIGFAIFGVMSLVDKRVVQVAFEPRMRHPMQCDATMAQRGAGEKWKNRCYVRRER